MRDLRILLLLLLVLLGWLQYRLWFGNGGQHEVDALRQQVQRQTRDNAGLQQRNEALAAEVEDLKSGESAVEERARNELGMIKPGEVFYRVIEPEPVQSDTSAQSAAPVPAEASASDTAPLPEHAP